MCMYIYILYRYINIYCIYIHCIYIVCIYIVYILYILCIYTYIVYIYMYIYCIYIHILCIYIYIVYIYGLYVHIHIHCVCVTVIHLGAFCITFPCKRLSISMSCWVFVPFRGGNSGFHWGFSFLHFAKPRVLFIYSALASQKNNILNISAWIKVVIS